MALKGKPRDMNKWREVLLDPNVHFPAESGEYRCARNELLEAEAELLAYQAILGLNPLTLVRLMVMAPGPRLSGSQTTAIGAHAQQRTHASISGLPTTIRADDSR